MWSCSKISPFPVYFRTYWPDRISSTKKRRQIVHRPPIPEGWIWRILEIIYSLTLDYHWLVTFKRREVLDVNIGMWGRNISHVYSIQHYWNHIVGKDFPELFCDVVLAERILQWEIELNIILICPGCFMLILWIIKPHFVFPVNHLHTVSVIILTYQVTAGGGPINIHRDVFF